MHCNNTDFIETRHKILEVHFFKRLRDEFKGNERLAPLSAALFHLLNQEELEGVVNRVYGETSDVRFGNLKEKTTQELIMIIEDEYYVLDFLLDEIWKNYCFD